MLNRHWGCPYLSKLGVRSLEFSFSLPLLPLTDFCEISISLCLFCETVVFFSYVFLRIFAREIRCPSGKIWSIEHALVFVYLYESLTSESLRTLLQSVISHRRQPKDDTNLELKYLRWQNSNNLSSAKSWQLLEEKTISILHTNLLPPGCKVVWCACILNSSHDQSTLGGLSSR